VPWVGWLDAARLLTGFLLLSKVPAPSRWGRVRSDAAVIIPARNEAASLPALLESLKTQLGPGDELVVVDDSSEDSTAAVAEELGARVVPSGDLPQGWLGKPRACQVGADATEAPVLVFVDADVRFVAPGSLRSVVAEVDDLGGLVSVQPAHHPRQPAESLAAFFNLVSMMASGAFLPGGPKPRVAFGPVLACRRRDYEEIGGHESIKAEVLDDAALAAGFRKSGDRVRILGGRSAIAFRMYPEGLSQLIEGFTKNFAAGARTTRPALMVAVVFWMSGLMSAPFRGPLRYLLFAGQVSWLLSRIGRFQWWTGPAYPIPLVVFLAVFVRSLLAMAMGRPVSWKGRQVGGRQDGGQQG
jgi:4,4'-diaponeurosporenoate glycosyltransferase